MIIGEGRTSLVYKKDEKAVKKIDKKLYRKEEVEILKVLKHDCIIQLLDFTEEEVHVYLTFELFEGKNVYEWRKDRDNRMELYDKVINQLISAIQYIHEKSVVHGDLSSTNVLINIDNKVKVIDFGSSRKIGYEITEEKFITTPIYLPPELLSGQRNSINKSTDLWSLGVVIFLIITGNLPFSGNTLDAVYIRIIHCKINYEKVFKQYRKILKSLFKKNPNKRKIIKINAISSLE